MSFKSFGLDLKILSAIEDAGYITPTEVQDQAIPKILQGHDVLAVARTGTGKTASFILPMLHRLLKGRAKARMPRTLILEPTRELASQVADNFNLYSKNTALTQALLIGGMSFMDQEKAINRGADVIIATPGRLLDHVQRGKILLRGIEIFVIDESDRMLDMGFIPDIERIVKIIPFMRQTLFFSATMSPEIVCLSETFLSAPIRIEVASPSSTHDNVSQQLILVEKNQKREVLLQLLKKESVKNGIIFCNRKRDIAPLHHFLSKQKLKIVSLHGDMDQHTRMKMLDQFRNGEVDFLIASDVAARGLDIDDIGYIFNFDVPIHPEDYVHRIGRTGRAGKKGAAFTLFTEAERKYVTAIETLIGKTLTPLTDFLSRHSRHQSKTGQRRGFIDTCTNTHGEERKKEGLSPQGFGDNLPHFLKKHSS